MTQMSPHVSVAAPPADQLLPASESTAAQRGDLLVHGFFTCSSDNVFDIRLKDLDAKTHVNADPLKWLCQTTNARRSWWRKVDSANGNKKTDLIRLLVRV